MATVTDPFRTCLLGLPWLNVSSFAGYSTGNCTSSHTVANCTAQLLKGLNVTLPWDPQEIQLLGSQAIGNSSDGNWTQACVVFGTKYQGLGWQQAVEST